MTLAQMRYYSAVCQTMNITKAAQMLHISQPTLSAAIHAIEAECGVELFHHKANSLSITDEGLVLLDEITPILKSNEHLDKLISQQMLDRNYVRLSFSTITGADVCPQLCRTYRERYPDTQVIITEGNTEKHYEDLESGNVDMILTSRSRKISEEDWQKHYSHIKIQHRSQLMFCVGRNSPLAEKDFVTWEDIAQQPLILLDDPFSVGKNIEQDILNQGLSLRYAVQHTAQLFTVERFIEANAACGFLPRSAALVNPDIVAIETPYRRGDTVYLTWLRNKMQFSAVKRFIRVARELYPQV